MAVEPQVYYYYKQDTNQVLAGAAGNSITNVAGMNALLTSSKVAVPLTDPLTEGGNLTCSGSFAAGGSSNTFAGSVRIGGGTSNNLLSINGSHSTARMNIYYAGSIDAYNAYIDMWASEPGVTYNGSGIGSNVNGSPYYGRKVAAQGQTYIRFLNGQFEVWTGTNSSF